MGGSQTSAPLGIRARPLGSVDPPLALLESTLCFQSFRSVGIGSIECSRLPRSEMGCVLATSFYLAVVLPYAAGGISGTPYIVGPWTPHTIEAGPRTLDDVDPPLVHAFPPRAISRTSSIREQNEISKSARTSSGTSGTSLRFFSGRISLLIPAR